MTDKEPISRRAFLSGIAMAGTAGAIGTGSLFTSCRKEGNQADLPPLKPEAEWNIPDHLPDKAIEGVPLKVGLIGCGRRGAGAITDLFKAASGISVVALGDVFQDKIDEVRKLLKDKLGQSVPDGSCFTGFDSYEKVIQSGVDMVILATPPAFRPQHFKAAVEAGKHAFLEKPVAVDPVGVRSIIATSKTAVSKGLAVITGTQRHHNRSYIEGYKQIQRGMIGEIISATVCWNTGSHWLRKKNPRWTDMEWMLRDWGNWTWLSGDHIVEQHIHNLDVFNWFSGKKPVKAVGIGARQRRLTGDQYDIFSIDYTYEGEVHVHSMCRQIDGCSNNIFEYIQGTKGSWTNKGIIKDLEGNVVWKYDKEYEKSHYTQTNPYVLEHVNWINHIRNKRTICQAEESAISTLTAIMGRISAYTGREVSWEEMLASGLDLLPEDLSLRNLDMSAYPIPVPGKGK
ncbi:Gfo/Idh/MocA family protein [Parabacteroides pacaensis]|uniref:Gfo/Idh/MocA family protein n=1 Tax=Parabacteroides pacaensis TaxID=2086575 RepID=UPI000D105BA7|nr:Gfo/Idh/MocA family oxidoreductase [Parabacteroides pacaensis]